MDVIIGKALIVKCKRHLDVTLLSSYEVALLDFVNFHLRSLFLYPARWKYCRIKDAQWLEGVPVHVPFLSVSKNKSSQKNLCQIQGWWLTTNSILFCKDTIYKFIIFISRKLDYMCVILVLTCECGLSASCRVHCSSHCRICYYSYPTGEHCFSVISEE